jgi:uncharacterized protein
MEPDPIPLKTLVAATAGVVSIEAAARWAISCGYFPAVGGTGLARLAGIAWMVAVITGAPSGWVRLGLGRGLWAAGLRRGLIWSAGFGLVAGAGLGACHLMGIDWLRLLGSGPVARGSAPALLFLVGGLIAPVAEEIYFRGILYGYLRRWGFWPALVLSTSIFALLHPGAAGMPLVQIAGGLVFAVAYEVEKNLMVPIVIHVLGNLAIFSLPHVLSG